MDERPLPAATFHEIPWLRLFPWLRLGRAPGAAADVKRLVIAAVGFVALNGGWGLLDGRQSEFAAARNPIDSYWGGASVPAAEPYFRLIDPFVRLFQSPVHAPNLALTALAALWAVAVWGLCGGAIARIAAVEQAKGERIGLKTAVDFAAKHAVTLLGTPLVPLAGVAVVAVPVALFGLLYRLGNAGSLVAGVLAVVPLALAVLFALLLVGLLFGWPLMIASVAVEGEDAFDAMSRTYAYVRQRPWHYAAYALLALALGTAGWTFVEFFARLVVHLAGWGVSLSAPAPVVTKHFLLHGDLDSTAFAVTDAHSFWIGVVVLLARAWLYSYFWTAATTIYFLLRREVDGTPLNMVSIPQVAAPPPSPEGVKPVEAPEV